jgi:hypothetical protein
MSFDIISKSRNKTQVDKNHCRKKAEFTDIGDRFRICSTGS